MRGIDRKALYVQFNAYVAERIDLIPKSVKADRTKLERLLRAAAVKWCQENEHSVSHFVYPPERKGIDHALGDPDLFFETLPSYFDAHRDAAREALPGFLRALKEGRRVIEHGHHDTVHEAFYDYMVEDQDAKHAAFWTAHEAAKAAMLPYLDAVADED